MSRNRINLSVGQVGGLLNIFQRMPVSFWGILGISLIVKLALIDLKRGEYTDGIIQLELWSSRLFFSLRDIPPRYGSSTSLFPIC
jgi:hypothetical protein